MKITRKPIARLTAVALVALPLLYLKYRNENLRYPELVTLRVVFLQTDCGDESDDVLLETVSEPRFSYLIGKELDPVISTFDTDLTEEFHRIIEQDSSYRFTLTGYIGKNIDAGCNKKSPCFWVKKLKSEKGSEIEFY